MEPSLNDRPRPAMARPPSPATDPAADAAALLRRLGFAALMLVVPVAALLTRRAVVVIAPIAIILLVIAAVLDGAYRPLGGAWVRLWRSPAFLAGALALAWSALSLAWTPLPGPAFERLLNVLVTAALAFTGYLALPNRMRSANLYLLPIGVAVAALLAILFGLLGLPSGVRGLEDDSGSLERGLVVLSLLVWPAVAWLRSRGRDVEALGVAVLVTFAAIFAPRPLPVFALCAGAVAFALTSLKPRLGVRATAAILPGLLALAPLLPFLVRPIAAAILPVGSPTVASLGVWRRIVTSEPLRLITGHGFETAFRGRFIGLLPANAPHSLLFEVWYELGIVGALAASAALYAAISATGRHHTVLAPGAMAAFASVFALASLGIGTSQMWWFTALTVLVLLFVAIERGQFRTTRPKASLLRAANDA